MRGWPAEPKRSMEKGLRYLRTDLRSGSPGSAGEVQEALSRVRGHGAYFSPKSLI